MKIFNVDRPTEGEVLTMRTAERLHRQWVAANHARVSKARPCVHSVLGKRHPPYCWQDFGACLPPGWDHVQMFNTPGGRVLTHHPYRQPEADEVAAFDQRWGTTTTVHSRAESWYYPGHSYLVVVRRAPADGTSWLCSRCRLAS